MTRGVSRGRRLERDAKLPLRKAKTGGAKKKNKVGGAPSKMF